MYCLNFKGKSKCGWSSCEEGCTKTVHTCWQVHVEYAPFKETTAQAQPPQLSRGKGRLFSNVKGCGYPPRVVCADFVAAHAKNGSVFKCFVSRADPQLVVASLDLDQVRSDLYYGLAIPVPSLLVSILYIVFARRLMPSQDSLVAARPMVTMAPAAVTTTVLVLSRT